MSNQAVLFGAGSVGRGFLGQLFSESGYDIVFVDIDKPLIAAFNARHSYTIRLVDNDGSREVEVSPVRAVHPADVQSVSQALLQADLAATAVGVRALPQIAPLVAQGIALRAKAGMQEPLNIIVCENLKDAAATFRTMVARHLPKAIHSYLKNCVGFVDTVIARMSPPPTPEMEALDPTLIVVEPYKELPVDRGGFVGPVPDIVGLEGCDDFGVYTARKLYLHNCGHAMLGYLGYQREYTFGYEALADAAIGALLRQALRESKAGIMAAYAVDAAWLQANIDDVVYRFGNRALGDTVYRLARDPQRKLAPQDRLVGAARLAERAGVSPEALSWGIAAGYCFDDSRDPLAAQLQGRIDSEGLEAVVADISGIQSNEPLAELVRHRICRLREGRWATS